MGLAEAIGYESKPSNIAQRAMQQFSSSRPGAWLFSKFLHRADRFLFSATNGRFTVPGIVAGLPILMITTTGAKSGQQRTMPLIGVPVGADLAIIGTNFGQTKTPGWVFNLEAHANCSVLYRDENVATKARPATAAEYDEAFAQAAKVYPGYDKYRTRISEREIRVFVLEIAEQS